MASPAALPRRTVPALLDRGGLPLAGHSCCSRPTHRTVPWRDVRLRANAPPVAAATCRLVAVLVGVDYQGLCSRMGPCGDDAPCSAPASWASGWTRTSGTRWDPVVPSLALAALTPFAHQWWGVDASATMRRAPCATYALSFASLLWLSANKGTFTVNQVSLTAGVSYCGYKHSQTIVKVV